MTDIKIINPRIFLADLQLLIVYLFIGVIAGWFVGHWEWGVLIALLIFSSWQFITIQRLLSWLNDSLNHPPPALSGGLGHVAKHLYQNNQQEKKLQQNTINLAKKLRSSLFALQDSVVLLDKNNKLEWWNQSAEELLLISSDNQGDHVFDLINSKEFEEYFEGSKKVGSSDSNANGNEGIRLQSGHDPELYLQFELTLFGKEKLLIIYDVTRLQHLEQMRKDFVANVSHELRTPLTVLMGYIETFSDQADIDPKWQRGFSLMTKQTKRMNFIINDLLMLSRLESQESFETCCVDMPLLMSHLFDDAQIYNKDYKHLIDLHIDSQMNLIGSEMYLNSAFLNLVTNAIKYTPNGGEIHISWVESKKGCTFSVTDSGLGIAPEHIERLTERFYRVDSGRSRMTGGTGLGLAIVKHILYHHEASLSIESIVDKGSTFKIFFPKHKICTESICEIEN